VGTNTRPYGFTSPFTGTVEATCETVVNVARNGVPGDTLVAAAVVAGGVVAAELELLVLLLELPHPAIASAVSGAASINRLFTWSSGGLFCAHAPRSPRDPPHRHQSRGFQPALTDTTPPSGHSFPQAVCPLALHVGIRVAAKTRASAARASGENDGPAVEEALGGHYLLHDLPRHEHVGRDDHRRRALSALAGVTIRR